MEKMVALPSAAVAYEMLDKSDIYHFSPSLQCTYVYFICLSGAPSWVKTNKWLHLLVKYTRENKRLAPDVSRERSALRRMCMGWNDQSLAKKESASGKKKVFR